MNGKTQRRKKKRTRERKGKKTDTKSLTFFSHSPKYLFPKLIRSNNNNINNNRNFYEWIFFFTTNCFCHSWLEMEWDEFFFLGLSIVKIPHCLTHKDFSLPFHGVKSEPRLGNFFTNCTLQHRREEKKFVKIGKQLSNCIVVWQRIIFFSLRWGDPFCIAQQIDSKVQIYLHALLLHVNNTLERSKKIYCDHMTK